MTNIGGLVFTQELKTNHLDVLTEERCKFVADLVDLFAEDRKGLLEDRQKWQAKIDAGALPDFRSDTKNIRSDDWKIGELPTALKDRRVEITGPTDRKMVINALNADVRVFMADFEDALAPSWENVINGQLNLRDAANRTIAFTDPNNNKRYELSDEPATLIARVRGLHLDEKHVLRNGQAIPGCLFDFGIYFHLNAARLLQNGHGPYFYVPKLEHAEEARWWNTVFLHAQAALGQPIGTIKATMLIETLPAVFEMDEILYELRDHAAALNCGRWDYIFSYIKTLRNHADRILPDRHSLTMDKPFLDAYSKLLVQTCHRRGALAMGGMSAFLPAKSPQEDEANKLKVYADKMQEAKNGHDGSWVAHPALAPVVNRVYEETLDNGQTNQLNKTLGDIKIAAPDLLQPAPGAFTEDGLRLNIRVAIQYMAAWLSGLGAVAINGLMEDAATAEISRASIWQWLKNEVKLSNGKKVDAPLFNSIFGEEVGKLKTEIGEQSWSDGNYDAAATALKDLCVSKDFKSFLTLELYPKL